ncbi:MAG: hypothetical protein HY574_08810 [candidate division NC10 bacterium]|nr:hypothetical protein [candidate division NC10 bacterium]
MQRKRCGAILLCMGFLAQGCASYKGQPLSVARSLRFRATADQVTLQAEPLSGTQVEAAFDAKPEEIRVLFVRALFQNAGETPYRIERKQIRLVTNQGIALTPVSPSRVARKMRLAHDALAVGSVFLFEVLSYPSFHSANEASDAMVQDLTKKTFPELVELAPHTTLGGMLYFELPSYVTPQDSVRIDAALKPGSGAEPLILQVPLIAEPKEGV